MASIHVGLFSGTVDGPPLLNHEKQATAITDDISQYANATFRTPMKIFAKFFLFILYFAIPFDYIIVSGVEKGEVRLLIC